MKRNLSFLALAFVLLARVPAIGENWPEFRGPTGQGILPIGKLPIAWGPDKNVVWKQAIPGKGWSSPIVQEGGIYLTASVPSGEQGEGNDQSLRALCLDAKTGKILWDKEVFRQDGEKAPRIHGKNSHASPTPLTDGKNLYVHFGHQGTACLDLAGKILWRNTDFKYQPVHGNGGSPILVDDALVFSCDGGEEGFVAALKRTTGKVHWKTDRSVDAARKFSFTTPLLITVKGKKQIISPASDMVAAYDPATGKEIWKVRYQGYSVIPRPVFGKGLVFIGTGYDVPSILAIRPDGQGDVTETHVAWKTRKSAPHAPSFLQVGDELYAISDRGVATCFDAKTGKIHWQKRIGGSYSASPIFADGKIYFQSEDGPAYVIAAGKEFKQLAKNDLGERTLASHAALKGVLFIRTEKHLYRVEEK